MDNPLAELDAWWVSRFQDDEDSETVLLRYVEEEEAIHIEFATAGGEDTARLEQAKWRLDIEDLEESFWCWENGEPRWFADHPLLVPYNASGALLSFAKPLEDPSRAWGSVARAHRALVGDWFPLERFFRTDLLDARFGQLASGPERLLSVYADALRSVGEDVGYAPLVGWSMKEASLSVVTWGKSSFVARAFHLERIG